MMIKSRSCFRILSVFLAVFLLFPFYSGAAEALPMETSGETPALGYSSGMEAMPVATGGVLSALGCSSGDELLELLRSGGERDIYLTDDVVIQIDNGNVSAEPAALTTVHTGDYGVTIQGSRWLYTRNIIFEGSGITTPVLTVNNGALLGQEQTTVRATGDNAIACRGESLRDITIIADGKNSVAVQQDTTYSFLNNCAIYARGADGVGVKGDGILLSMRKIAVETGFIAVDARLVQTVELEDSVLDAQDIALWAGGDVAVSGSRLNAGTIAIKAAGDIDAFGSDLIAGSFAIETDGVISLDCTYTEPKQQGVETVLRNAVWGARNNANGEFLRCGEDITEYDYNFTLLDFDHVIPERTQRFEIEWDISNLDMNTPGTYTVYCTPVGFKLLEMLEGVGRTPVRVTIMEPGKPYLVASSNWWGETYIAFSDWIDDAEDIVLSYSIDEGETWSSIARSSNSSDVIFAEYGISVYFAEDEVLYLFRAEIIGGNMAGTTNIIPHWYSPIGTPPPISGDWDLGDRGNQGPLPDAPIVRPDPSSPRPDSSPVILPKPAPVKSDGYQAGTDTTKIQTDPQPDMLQEPVNVPFTQTDMHPVQTEQPSVWQSGSTPDVDFIPAEAPTISGSALAVPQAATASTTIPGVSYLWITTGVAVAAAFLTRLFKKRLRYPLFLAGAALCGLTIFLLCYQYDNKYMYPRHPSVDGVTILQMSAYTDNPFLYLVNGWEYYDDEFLTSQELQDAIPDTYLYIGRYGGFDLGDPQANPHGRATYRMTILADDIERDYALELTKIYSRWQLFVNGELYQSVGMPVSGDVTPQNGGNMISFRANGSIELVYHVEDDDGYYSGMVYPPAFGSPEAVGRMLSLRLLLHVGACTVAALIGFLCLFAAFGLRFARPYRGLFCLCACFMIYTAYPVFQAVGLNGEFWTLAGQFCYYSMFLHVLWIQGQLCEIPRKLRVSICGLAGVVCLSVLLLPLATVSTAAPLYAYSRVLTAYKWLTAVYLLASSAWAVRRGNTHAVPLVAGFCVYAAALVVDRVYPLYEPILSGWHLETAGFIIILIVTGLLMRDTLQLYREHLLLREQSRMAEYQLEVQRKHGVEQAEYVKTTRGELHEYRNRLAVIRHYLDAGEQGRMREYLDGLLRDNRESPPAAYTDHQLVNAVLHAQLGRAEQSGIYTEFDLTGISETLAVADGDIASMLMNLMDNAIEACLRIPDEGGRWIIFRMCYEPGDNGADSLQIACSNASLPGKKDLSTVKSDKKAHGHGLDIMRGIAEAYGGNLEIKQNEETFTVTIVMRPNQMNTAPIIL